MDDNEQAHIYYITYEATGKFIAIGTFIALELECN